LCDLPNDEAGKGGIIFIAIDNVSVSFSEHFFQFIERFFVFEVFIELASIEVEFEALVQIFFAVSFVLIPIMSPNADRERPRRSWLDEFVDDVFGPRLRVFQVAFEVMCQNIEIRFDVNFVQNLRRNRYYLIRVRLGVNYRRFSQIFNIFFARLFRFFFFHSFLVAQSASNVV
jgi:hypothetical protein